NISKVLVAFIAFGLNSGAYVSEIIRSGLSAVDAGQLEAGRSLGFGYGKTMQYIIIPQALKNILPALGNEFIVLLKETSISGYIALTDLTRVGTIIQAETYDAFMPLLAVAAIYLVLVIIFSKLVSMLERRLAKSDRS
ncbi:MAG TPA: amino acid ABC transporter permease, partial [Bacillota bacterium]|nr:amino acid ABC transporter permease [Bacillota bacterium]